MVKRGQLKFVLIAGRDRVQKQCAWGGGWVGLAIRQKSLGLHILLDTRY